MKAPQKMTFEEAPSGNGAEEARATHARNGGAASSEKRDARARWLSFVITTHCNQKCPECSMGIPRISSPKHYEIEYIQKAASLLYGQDRVDITGGEPTLHPHFRQLVPQLKEMFGCRLLVLATNGYRVREFGDVLHHFDLIKISHFDHNQREVDYVRQHFTETNPPGPTLHVCTQRRARNPRPCSIANGLVKYVYGRLYPCCVIPSGLEHRGIALTNDWRQRIERLSPPCAECFMAEEGEPFSTDADLIRSLEMNQAKMSRHSRKRETQWPLLRNDVVVYGLSVDSWMEERALIWMGPQKKVSNLAIDVESHAPHDIHPITLTFRNAKGKKVFSHVVREPKKGRIKVPLNRLLSTWERPWCSLHSDTIFVPRRLDPDNPDERSLSVRLASLRLGE